MFKLPSIQSEKTAMDIRKCIKNIEVQHQSFNAKDQKPFSNRFNYLDIKTQPELSSEKNRISDYLSLCNRKYLDKLIKQKNQEGQSQHSSQLSQSSLMDLIQQKNKESENNTKILLNELTMRDKGLPRCSYSKFKFGLLQNGKIKVNFSPSIEKLPQIKVLRKQDKNIKKKPKKENYFRSLKKNSVSQDKLNSELSKEISELITISNQVQIVKEKNKKLTHMENASNNVLKEIAKQNEKIAKVLDNLRSNYTSE